MSYPNDNFADATALTGASGSITPFHYDGTATSESGEDLYGGAQTLWWKWTAPADGSVSFTTSGSTSDDASPYGLDTLLHIFTGDFTSALAGNDDGSDVLYEFNSRLDYLVTAGVTYYIQVDYFGRHQVGTLHLSWDLTAYYYGPWLTPPSQSLELTVTNDSSNGPGAHPNTEAIGQGVGTAWADPCEVEEGAGPNPTVGTRGKGYTWNPPAFIEYARAGEAAPGYSQNDDTMHINQFPFEPHFGSNRSSLANYTPAVPADALDVAYEGPTSFDPATWDVAVEGRFLIHVNDSRSADYLENVFLEPITSVPVGATVQVRAVTPYFAFSGADGIFMPGSYLASQPLIWEQTVDATDEVVDSGWVPIDVDSLETRQLYLGHAEQISHVSPAPSPLPDRLPSDGSFYGTTQAWYAAARWDGDVGFGTGPGDGDVRQIQLRFTWTSPRYRFVYNHPVTLTIPPLRQWPRDDGLRRNPGRTAATSRQGSLRRGPRGTYT